MSDGSTWLNCQSDSADGGVDNNEEAGCCLGEVGNSLKNKMTFVELPFSIDLQVTKNCCCFSFLFKKCVFDSHMSFTK